MWAYERTFYQIYPLGMCGAPKENDGVMVPRIRRVLDWGDHLEKLGVGAVVFNPVFQSDRQIELCGLFCLAEDAAGICH